MKKIFLSVLLALTVVCGLLGFAACGDKNEGLIFTEYSAVEGVVSYEISMDKYNDYGLKVKEIKIPETYNGGKVTVIAERAFKNCALLEKVTIPKSIELIRSEAFMDAPLKQIIFEGTKAQWDNIEKANDWIFSAAAIPLLCADGSWYAYASK